MLDQEIEEIIALLIRRTIATREHYTLQEILDADIPPGIKTFLAADIVQRFRQEMTSASRNEAHQRSLEYRFSREDFLIALDNAVHFLVNYLCRPQWTLQEFLLDGGETATDTKLVSKLSSLYDYDYYCTLLVKVLEAKGWREISRDRLRHMLSSIDEGYLKGMKSADIASLASPMFSFLSLRNSPSSNRIPYRALIVFLADKAKHTAGDYLEKVCQVRNTPEISLQEFAEVLQDMPEGYEPLPAGESVARVSTNEEELPEVSDGAETSTEEESKEPTTEPSSPPHIQKRNLALSLTFAGLIEKPQVSTRISVNSFISPDLRTLFVKELFNNDPAYYSAIVATLDATAGWKDAESYMTRFCEINELDPSGHEIAQFMEIVRQRFLTESPGNA